MLTVTLIFIKTTQYRSNTGRNILSLVVLCIYQHPFQSCLHSAVSVGRANPRCTLWGLHQPDPSGHLRGSVDSLVQLCGAPVGVPPYDELQWTEPWLCLRQIRLIHSSNHRYSRAAWSHAGTWLPSLCPPQHWEETPLYRRVASFH